MRLSLSLSRDGAFRRGCFVPAILIAATCSAPLSAADWYVRVGGNDLNPGSTWGSAFATVQKAINVAGVGDTIRVGAGVYLPTNQLGSSNRSKTFRLGGASRTLRGGYPASPTGAVAQDPSAYETILSGDLALDDATIGTDENAFHVVSFIGAEPSILLDGFVVQAGNAAANGGSTQSSEQRGGGVYMTHDWAASGSACRGVLQNSTIRLNEGRYGGGLVVDGDKPSGTTGSFPVARPSIRTTLVRDNVSWKGGGGMHWIEAAPEAAGCVIVENYCDFFAGGIEVERPIVPSGGIPAATIVNCTIAFNENSDELGGLGAGVHIAEAENEDTVVIESSIVTNNISGATIGDYAAQINGEGSAGTLAFVVNHSCIANITDPGATPSASQLGTGNIGATAPGFVDAALGNYRLLRTSPCIDKGTTSAAVLPIDTYDADYDLNTTEPLPDHDRSERIIHCRVDMGAFESACAADVDYDGDIDASDLAILLGAWGTCSGSTCAADLDCDGDVNATDLAVLLGAWGSCGTGDSSSIGGGGESGSSMSGGLVDDPAALAELLGFSSTEDFAGWLGTLSAEERSSVLFGFLGGAL